MLTIKNIHRFEGMVSHGKCAYKSYATDNNDYYVFCYHLKDFEPNIRDCFTAASRPEIKVYLERIPSVDGRYRVFVMGHAIATEVWIERMYLERAGKFSRVVRHVFEKLEKAC